MESIIGRTPSTTKNSRITLLSVAGTTDRINQHVNETVIDGKSERFPRVLIVKDGWTNFNKYSDVDYSDKLKQRLQGPAEKLWTKSWLKYVLGKNALISTVNLRIMDRNDLRMAIGAFDSIILPGGNTFQLYKGVKKHRDIIQESVNSGKISYIGESAGSIIAGSSLYSAFMPPSDACPSGIDPTDSLKLIGSNIIVHAEGESTKSTIPIIGKIADVALKNSISTKEDINRFLKSFGGSSQSTIILKDNQAARFQSGKLRII